MQNAVHYMRPVPLSKPQLALALYYAVFGFALLGQIQSKIYLHRFGAKQVKLEFGICPYIT